MKRAFAALALCIGCTRPMPRALIVPQPSCIPAPAPVPPAQVAEPSPLYRDVNARTEERVKDLLGRMTIEEKAQMLSGSAWMESRGIERLGIPAIKMTDGPMGVRNWMGPSAPTNGAAGKNGPGAHSAAATTVNSTAFPAGINMASTWDTDLVRAEGRAIGREVRALGRDMLLGPTVNIQRTPLWGRNFEAYGEDPYLTARMTVAYIEGVQSEGVIATVKHFVANNQEHERHRIDERLDLRALHEIYFPAFRAAVEEAHVGAVMSAFNKVNGTHCAENSLLLTDTLKKRWGFKGFVVSDWGSTHSTADTIRAGMDLEMPGGLPMQIGSTQSEFQSDGKGSGWLVANKVMAALQANKVGMAAVDENVGRLLRVIFASGLFDGKRPGGGEVDAADHKALARTAATQSIVLLKNDRDLLPLQRKKTRSIAVIGPNAAVARSGGGGSSQVRPKYAVSPLEGITHAAGGKIKVQVAPGVPMPGEEVRNGYGNADHRSLRKAAVTLATRSDVAVVVVGNSPKLESEGFDRPSMDLPKGQDDLIQAVSAANKRTIVVVVAGAPVTMTRWIQRVSAVLFAGYAGQESGNAIADLLFGTANPSAKTPMTFPRRIEDSPAHDHYPGKDLHVDYAEGIYVGYRGFDKGKTQPLFPFGHGLSYSRFEYGGLKVSTPTPEGSDVVTISAEVRNASSRGGAEVVQMYLHDLQSSWDRPEKELKGFRRIGLAPGETKSVTFTVDKTALSFFDPKRQEWAFEPGSFEVLIGASSRDIRLRGTFNL